MTRSRRGSRRAATPRTAAGRSARCRALPRQTWYCSVSLRWKRRCGGGASVSAGRRLRLARARRAALAERLRDELDDLVVVDVAGRSDDDVARHVHLLVVAGDRLARDRRDHLGGADHRAAERMVAEHGLGDQVVHELLRRVVVHRDLLEHDVALGIELGERGREHHLAHHVHRRLELVVGDARVDERVLARGGGVQLAAETVEDLGDLQRAVPVGSLEQQVLDEVRHARLVSPARHASRRRSSSRPRPSAHARGAPRSPVRPSRARSASSPARA